MELKAFSNRAEASDAAAQFVAAKTKALGAVVGVISKKMKPRSERGLPRGVYKTPSGKFLSTIKWRGKGRSIGTFDTPEQASAAFMSVKKDRDDANVSSFGADKIDAMFDAAKKKALEKVQAMKESAKYGDEYLV